MEKQSFAYEKKDKGICILRCYGVSGRVEIPETLEGVPVTEMSAYAFARSMEQEPQNASGLPCICGEDLQELYLPGSMKRLGRYLFYNCRNFRRLSFYSDLEFIGAGAFTGCENLSYLEMRWRRGNSCLREILQDLKQKVTVGCYLEEGERTQEGGEREPVCRLVYPEFFEEAVENTPARIISTQTHGMGIQYRNAFRNTQVNLKEYDKLFDMGKYNIDSIDLAELAVARLRCPYELGEAERAAYAGWLSENLETGAAYCLKREYPEDLRWLAETFVTEEGQMELLLREAERQDAPEIVSMLMDARHRRFPAKKKKFSL
ncbi:leucine-rich repeat protein [Lachnospiraceae bacterium 45-W7]